MTRLAITPPPFCAACFNAPGPEKRYVDFEAAYDGPVVPGAPANQPVDDLVICEDCLSEAFALLDPQGLKGRIEWLERVLESAQKEIKAKDIAIEGLRHATNEIVEHGVTKVGARPSMQSLSPETRKVVADARQERRERNKVGKTRSGKSKKRSEAMKAVHARRKAELEAEKTVTPSPQTT